MTSRGWARHRATLLKGPGHTRDCPRSPRTRKDLLSHQVRCCAQATASTEALSRLLFVAAARRGRAGHDAVCCCDGGCFVCCLLLLPDEVELGMMLCVAVTGVGSSGHHCARCDQQNDRAPEEKTAPTGEQGRTSQPGHHHHPEGIPSAACTCGCARLCMGGEGGGGGGGVLPSPGCF